jgi:transposase
LAVVLSAANTHDSMLLEQVVDAVPPIKGPQGCPARPRKRPAKLHLDKGYDYPRCRRALRRRRITPRIARRGIESSARLGRHRWVIERSLAWLVGYRRLQLGGPALDLGHGDVGVHPPTPLIAVQRRAAYSIKVRL